MVNDAEDAERSAHARLRSKQETMQGQNFEAELDGLAASLDGVQRRAANLRQVRFRES